MADKCQELLLSDALIIHREAGNWISARSPWLVGLIVGALAWFFWPRTFPLDDAYITLHNARALLHGWDETYNVSPLVGATSPVHLAIITLLGMVMPLPDAMAASLSASFILYVVGLWHLRPNPAFVFIGISASFVLVWLFNGLETSLAMAAVVWTFVLIDSKRLPLLLGLLPFIRPDLTLLAVPLALREIRVQPFRVFALGLVASIPFAAWLYISTGEPFPNTAGAKLWFFANDAENLLQRLRTVGWALLLSLIPLLSAGLYGLFTKRAGWCGVIYIAALLFLSIAFMPGNLAHNDYRYLAPVVPILCYGLTVFPSRILVALAALCAITSLYAYQRLFAAYQTFSIWTEGAEAASKLPANSRLVVHDAGLVAWRNPDLRMVDMIGLKSPDSTAIMKRYRVRPCQWGGAIGEIAVRFRATHIIILESPYFSCIVTDLRNRGWQLTSTSSTRLHIYEIKPPSRPNAVQSRHIKD